MGSLSCDLYCKMIAARVVWSGCERNDPAFKLGAYVASIYPANAVQKSFFHKQPRAGSYFLGLLEKQPYLSGKFILFLIEYFCRRKKHGRVRVVSAGMAVSIVLRAVWHVFEILHFERVHIGAEGNDPVYSVFGLSVYPSVNSCFSDPPVRNRELVQFILDLFACVIFLKAFLGVRMEVSSEFNKMFFFFFYIILYHLQLPPKTGGISRPKCFLVIYLFSQNQTYYHAQMNAP